MKAMTRVGKTFKDQKDRKAERAPKEPVKQEKGGHHNLIREAIEEELDAEVLQEEDPFNVVD